MEYYYVVVVEWEWDSERDETVYREYEVNVWAETHEEAESKALEKAYDTLTHTPDNELYVKETWKQVYSN